MDRITKQTIALELRNYCLQFESQNKAAATLKNISVAYVSQMINGQWDKISDEKWRSVAKQLGIDKDEWVIIPTSTLTDLTAIYQDAAENALVMAVISKSSAGKTESAKHYIGKNKNVAIISCEDYGKRVFMIEILAAIGVDARGLSSYEMSKLLVKHAMEIKELVLIFDEADKLNDKCICLFITLYNKLEGNCGIVLQATKRLRKKFEAGLRNIAPGYEEAYSRLGSNFIEVEENTTSDFYNIIKANGITAEETIYQIINDSQGDIRRIKRLVYAYKKEGAI